MRKSSARKEGSNLLPIPRIVPQCKIIRFQAGRSLAQIAYRPDRVIRAECNLSGPIIASRVNEPIFYARLIEKGDSSAAHDYDKVPLLPAALPSSTGLKPLSYTKRGYATLDFEERIYRIEL